MGDEATRDRTKLSYRQLVTASEFLEHHGKHGLSEEIRILVEAHATVSAEVSELRGVYEQAVKLVKPERADWWLMDLEAAVDAVSGRQFPKINVPLLDPENHQNDIGFRLQALAYDCVDELDCQCEFGDPGASCLRCAAMVLKTELQKLRRAAADSSPTSIPVAVCEHCGTVYPDKHEDDCADSKLTPTVTGAPQETHFLDDDDTADQRPTEDGQ